MRAFVTGISRGVVRADRWFQRKKYRTGQLGSGIYHACVELRALIAEGAKGIDEEEKKKIEKERERETKGTSFDFGCTGSSFRLRAALMTRFSCSSFH